MAFNRFYVISPLALIAVSACRSPYVAESAVSGAVVKGPLSNALVFLDYNDDGILDRDNEPFAQTDSFGEYELTATQDTYTLIAMATDQTVDTSSGAALSGITLKAPSGATVITPTTTLMEEGDISAEEVAAVLGLPDGVDPLSFNPFNVDENDAAAVAAALEVEKVSQQIMTAVTSFASAAEGAGAGAGDAFTAALGSVVDVVKAKAEKIDDPTAAAGDAELDFTDAADLALIKTEATSKAAALDGIDVATMNALADDTTDAIENINLLIENVTDLDDQATKDVFSIMQVLQDEAKAGSITLNDPDLVDAAALNSAPSAITLSGDRLVSADGELVVGTVATIDPNTDDTTFTYTLAGDDAKFFDFDASSGELSLKAAPDFDVKPYYEITIITKDPGGKPYAETFIIDVVPEFGSLVDPDPTVASDFNTIVLQNPLFMQMSSAVELKQTSDGQLVLVELMSSDDDEYSSSSDSEGDGPINAFINVSDRGYELRNPANNEYMGGFFTYEQDGLTYTGYEVLVDDMSVLAKYDTDLTKYFDPESTYGTGQLTYTARDIKDVAIAGVKVVDKDGVTVQDMLGFNHYGKDMNPLGSAGVDVADPSVPYYIEVVGEYDPAVTTNITATDITVLHDASVGLEMQTLLQSAAEAVLYGDDHDHDEEEGDDAVNGGNIVTSDGSTTDGGTVAAITLPPLMPTNTVEYDVTVANGKYLIDGVLLETLDLEEGKTYRFNQSDSSNATHTLKFSEAVDGAEYTENVVIFGTPGTSEAFSQITLGYASPDLNIICENHSGMGLALTTTPRPITFLGDVDLVDPLLGTVASLKVAEVSEFTPGALIGEISVDTGSGGGDTPLPIFDHTGSFSLLRTDYSSVENGIYAMDEDYNRLFEVELDSGSGGYMFTTENPILLAVISPNGIVNYKDHKIPLGEITLSASEPNVAFEITGQDFGFVIDGNKVYLGDNWAFDTGREANGVVVDGTSANAGGFALEDVSLSIAISGDMDATAAIDVIATNGDYFSLVGAAITAGGGYTFTPMHFNSFEFGAELGAITAAGFDFDTVGLPSGDAWIEIVGNTVKLKDNVYYDVNQETFNIDLSDPNDPGSFIYLSSLTERNVTATKDSVDLVSAPILWSEMVFGGQITQAPYWAGSPAGTKDLPTETNIKALMFENTDANGDLLGTTTHWAHDPSQDNSTLGDDIVITYSFVENSSLKQHDGAGSSGGPNQSTVWSMNDGQKASVKDALNAWSAVADITFVEVDESATDSLVGTLRFGFTTYDGDPADNVAGWASGPGGGTGHGDVWITSTDDSAGLTQRANGDLFQKGYSQGFLTVLHEIGHALGLAHPFEGFLMEGADPSTGEGAPLDHQKYTVMSYTVDDTVWFNGPAHPNQGYAISHTPMKEDIAAIQWLYGAQETNEGDTVYGSDYFDPATPFAMAIWDSGGVDTIDLSAFTEGCDLSLVAGTSSTVVCPTGGTGWTSGQMLDNLSIAAGATIENIIAGSGDDIIIGNDADNVLTGGAGADIFEFNANFGSDTITDFVVGEDSLRFLDSESNVITDEYTWSRSTSAGGEDLILSYLDDELTLEGLGSETFDDSFLELV